MMKYSLQNDKGTYSVRFRIKNERGEWVNKSCSTGIKAVKGNKRKAEQRAQEIISEWEGRTYTPDMDSLLADYTKRYIENRRSKVSPTTHSGYVHMFAKHIEPYFRAKNLKTKDVKPYHLEEYYAVKLSDGLNPNTVIKQATLLYSVFKDAMKNGIILVNPAELADKPKREKFEPVSYTKEEVLKLWQEVQGTIMELPVYFALFFGLRRSEAVGVKWSAIDFDNHILNVNNKITLVHSGGAVHITESSTMKSETSKSCYPLNEEQCRYLKSVQEKQRQYIRITDDYTDYVCVNEIGELISPDYVTHKFSKLLKSLGLKHIRFHDLRHCCISLLANDPRFTMKQVQEYARHANFNITADTYSHADQNTKAAELDALTEFLMSDIDKQNQ